MNVIFLDVDGVLNTINSNELLWFHNKEDLKNVEKFKIIKRDEVGNIMEIFDNNITFKQLHTGEGILNINCILRLKKIIDNIKDVKIVMSSYWRLSEWKMKSLKHYLQRYGIDTDIIIDFTPRMYHSRTKEIMFWIDHHFNVNKWVAIDDMHLELEKQHFVLTDPLTGLTDDDVKQVIELFK